ncbi:hypothetical protein ACFLSW_06385, partial [Candidatus Bipolaricaulota bacterium]
MLYCIKTVADWLGPASSGIALLLLFIRRKSSGEKAKRVLFVVAVVGVFLALVGGVLGKVLDPILAEQQSLDV